MISSRMEDVILHQSFVQIGQEHPHADNRVPLNSDLIRTCKSESLRVVAIQAERALPGTPGASVKNGRIALNYPKNWPRPMALTITVLGLRQGSEPFDYKPSAPNAEPKDPKETH